MKKPHKKLDAWKAALDLVLALYRTTDRFPEQERFSLTSQIRRAALSVPSNIAEGAARQTKKEFINFLHMAQGSLSELDTQLEVAKELGYLDKDRWATFDDQIERIDKLISGLIRHLKNSRRLERETSPHALPLTPHA